MIMAMDDIDVREFIVQEFDRRAVEKNPALSLVGKIFAGLRVNVNAVAIEKPVVADQKDLHRRLRHGRHMNVIRHFFPTQINACSATDPVRLETELVEIDMTITRNNDGDI